MESEKKKNKIWQPLATVAKNQKKYRFFLKNEIVPNLGQINSIASHAIWKEWLTERLTANVQFFLRCVFLTINSVKCLTMVYIYLHIFI